MTRVLQYSSIKSITESAHINKLKIRAKMLKLRLARVGKRKKPFYRLVVSDNRKDMYGDHLENLGHFNPHNKEVVLKEDRIKHWLSVGAQASETVHNLLVKEGVLPKDKVKAKAVSITKKRQTKLNAKKKVAEPEVKEEAPVETKVEETPVVEEKVEAAPTEEVKE